MWYTESAIYYSIHPILTSEIMRGWPERHLCVENVFTQEPPGPLPDKGPSPHPTMSDICISKEGMEKMLQNIKPDKAAGPDPLPATVLKELSHEIAPILELIYCR